MHLLLALGLIFLHNVVTCSCRSVTRQLGAHPADTARDSAESYELRRDEIPELLKQFLEQNSLESLDSERVQKNVAKLTIEPYNGKNITAIKWKKRDPAQLPKKRSKTIAPLAIIVTNLPELTRLRGRAVGGKASVNKKSKLKHQQSNWHRTEPDASNELDVTNKSDVIQEADDTNGLFLTNETVILEADDTKELETEKRNIIKEREDTNELVLSNESNVITEKGDTNELDIIKERDVIKETDDNKELGLIDERDIIKEKDDTNELDLIDESNVIKERDDNNGLLLTDERNVIEKTDDSKELDLIDEKDIIKETDDNNRLSHTNERNVTKERGDTNERDITNKLNSPQHKTIEMISLQQKTNKLIRPQQKTTSLKNNQKPGNELRSSSLLEGSINVDAAAESRVVKTIVIEPDVNMDVITGPGAGAPAQHPEARAGTRGPCAEIREDADWTQRQSTRNIYNISFLFNR